MKYLSKWKVKNIFISIQGLVHLQLGSPRLAEMTLRAAIRLDPNNHVSWYNLGLVMEVSVIISTNILNFDHNIFKFI